MKRFIIVLLTLLFVVKTAFADSTDYSSMPFNELQAVKNAVDQEYFSRPESSGFVLTQGVYVVGEQIKPGQYYIAMTEPNASSSSSFIAIYENKETFEQEEPYFNKLATFFSYMFLYKDAQSIVLKEGNIVRIDEGIIRFKASPFTKDELYKYEAPEGTLVPNGIYTVGIDIPEGTYTAFPATSKGGELSVYTLETNESGEQQKKKSSDYGHVYIPVMKETVSKQLILKNDEIVEVFDSVILQKQQKLNFD